MRQNFFGINYEGRDYIVSAYRKLNAVDFIYYAIKKHRDVSIKRKDVLKAVKQIEPPKGVRIVPIDDFSTHGFKFFPMPENKTT